MHRTNSARVKDLCCRCGASARIERRGSRCTRKGHPPSSFSVTTPPSRPPGDKCAPRSNNLARLSARVALFVRARETRQIQLIGLFSLSLCSFAETTRETSTREIRARNSSITSDRTHRPGASRYVELLLLLRIAHAFVMPQTWDWVDGCAPPCRLKRSSRAQVTALAWNPQYLDLFAAGYGSYDFTRQGSGMVCCFSMKNTSNPEYVFTTESGVRRTPSPHLCL